VSDQSDQGQSRRVADYWSTDRKRAIPISWLEHPTILRHVHRRVTGDPLLGTYQYWKNKFLPQAAGLCLSLGCGTGTFERDMIKIGASKRFHAHDLSEGAIAKARADAAAEGLGELITYSVTDLNNFILPRPTYNAIFAISSAHHVSNLENFFTQCRRALVPGGLLFLDEYIGPNRFQCTPLALVAINKLLRILPDRYRRDLIASGAIKESFHLPTVESFEATDPSEAIRSADIVPTMKASFEIVEMRPYGGAIMHMLLSGLTGNFRENDPNDVALLNMIALFEEELENAGALATDFAAIVARPRT
jgi:SAM-dependent methyltransferase